MCPAVLYEKLVGIVIIPYVLYFMQGHYQCGILSYIHLYSWTIEKTTIRLYPFDSI